MIRENDGLRVATLIPGCCRQVLMGNTLDKAVALSIPKDCECPKAVADSLWTLMRTRQMVTFDHRQGCHVLTPAGDMQARQCQ